MVFSNFTIEGDVLLTTIIRAIGVIMFMSWPLLTGHALYQRVPEKFELPYTLFVINCFITIAAYAFVQIILKITNSPFGDC